MKAEIVIIGGGISGVSIAYHLAALGQKNIVVIEKSFLASGATGRCGAGVRQQWGTKLNCLLAQASMQFFEKANQTLNYDGDIELKQEGYLIVTTTEEEKEDFKRNVILQNSLQIPSVFISPSEALKIVPHLCIDEIVGATYCPTDGHLNPFKMTDAFYQAAKKLGVEFLFHEEVKAIQVTNKNIEAVITTKQTIETAIVVNAAGGYAREVGQMVGIDIPVYSENHEILVTEPVEKMQGPMVMSFSKNIYCQQVPNGNFIMGRSNPQATADHSNLSSWQFLDEMAKTIRDLLPLIGNLRVLRQWGGSYNMSLDRQPILDRSREIPSFYVACGFSGHGFMFAPMTGLLLAQMILKQPLALDISELAMDRFNENNTQTIEKSVV